MKKILLSAAAALLALGASAQTAQEDVRIYINPGHGSWGPNNRHMPTIGHNPISSVDPDTTDFYESNTNLRKCLALLEKLTEYGVPFDRTKNQTNENPNRIGAALDLSQNIVMSHVKCGPYPYDTIGGVNPDRYNDFNRTLSDIAAEVEANNFDMFISVHSNAATEGNTTNYLYFAYDDDYTGNDKTASIEMSRCGWNHRILDRHTKWSHYDYTMTKEDVAAGKGKIGYQGLGVLNHSVSGYLVEGYFHTYQPARHKAMNFDVCRIEGIDYARGVADYYGWEKESYGAIYGIVRDKHTKFSNEVFTPKAGTTDVYKPINGAVVTLKQGENVIATDTTDVNYNGAFVFQGVQPGDYTVEFSHPDYFSDVYTDNVIGSEATTLNVTVKAAVTEYPEAFLIDTAWVAPTITYVNYPDSTAGKAGYKLLPSYEVKTSDISLLASQLEGKTVRRQIIRDDKLYVLALDDANEPYIYLADLANDTVMALDMAAVTMGGQGKLKISDIALTADHYLVANGMSTNNYDTSLGGYVNVYKWAVDSVSGYPSTCNLWFSTKTSSNMTAAIVGRSIAYSGTTTEGNLTITSEHGTKTENIAMRMERLLIADDKYIGDERLDAWAKGYDNISAYFYTDKLSSSQDYELMVSPRGTEDSVIYFIDGNKIAPMEFYFAETGAAKPATVERNETYVDAAVNGANFFKYAGRDLMVAPKVNEEGKVYGIKFFDITDGISKAKEIAVEGAEIEPVDFKYASAHGELALTFDGVGNTTGATIELFLVVDGKVTKFTCGDFYTSVNLAKNSITGTANPYAYALKSELNDKTVTLSYALNADATDVKVNVKDAEGTVVKTIEQGAQTKGAQSVEISVDDFEKGIYAWEVVVAGAEKTTIERFSTQSFYHPSGLDIDNNPENASFGTLFVCEGYNRGQKSGYVSAHADGSFGGGLYIFDAAGNQVLNKDGGARFYPSWLTNQDRNLGVSSKTIGADFGKVAIAQDGRIFVNRYNFNGDYYLVAENLETLVATGEFTSLLANKTMTDGIYYEGEEYLAGPAQSFDVFGGGEDLKLLALSRNDNTVDATFDENRVVEYNLGTGTALAVPTSVAALDQKYTISYDRKANVQYDNRGGIWYIQYRGTPSATQPALIYVDANGEIKFFEGDGGKARYQGAISVSPDGNRLVASSASGIVTVYGIIFTENGDVALNEQYRLTHNMGGSLYSAAWDAAGNFFLGNASNEVVQGYALPRAEAFTTPAAERYSFDLNKVGINGVSIDNENDAPVEYYNLQGVKVANPSNGVFIKVQGKKATKVFVK
ncbi:MAG: N-acetylmuramoyl-L-alanine amidase [Muribaculaceae bacterium]|nr:N-acetylmuramoyl-L-alanine amidase [Muribaculaceae bacterium]